VADGTGGPEFKADAYLDSLYGGIAISDPNAPKPPDPTGHVRLPEYPFLLPVYSFPIEWRKVPES
jgi:hypothetical protein